MAVLLAATVALELEGAAGQVPVVPSPRVPAVSVKAGRTAAAATGSAAALVALLARPLFAETRRPPEAETSKAQAAMPRLTGVVVSKAGKWAIFAAMNGRKATLVTEGGDVGPYVVRSIGVGQVTLAGPDGSRVLRPSFQMPGASALPPQTGLPLLASSSPALATPGMRVRPGQPSTSYR